MNTSRIEHAAEEWNVEGLTRPTVPSHGEAQGPNDLELLYRFQALLGQIQHSVQAAVKERLLATDLPDMPFFQWAVLRTLQVNGPMMVSDVARLLVCDPGNVTRACNCLERRGFLRRDRASEDRRVVVTSLTQSGERALAAGALAQAPALHEHLAGFSRAESTLLLNMLERIRANRAVHGARVDVA